MSERTRALMARWTPGERLRFGLVSLDAYFDALMEAELATGCPPEEAAARIRRRGRSLG